MDDDFPMNEGIGGPASDLGGWSWSGILAYTTDMYGGVGGEMMAEGGVTSMPDSGGSSGSVIPGSDGGSATPPNWDNELTNPNGLPVPSWTPHQGHGENAAIQPPVLRLVLRQVNSGLWGVPGYGWSGHFPADPNRATWFGPRKVADKYQPMPTKHPTGPRGDPFFSIRPPEDTLDTMIYDSPYEYEVPYQYFHQIGDVVTFPGNPANDNNPVGPNGAPHNWESYRRQIQLQKALAALFGF